MKSIEDLLQEKFILELQEDGRKLLERKAVYEYGCAMAYLNLPEMKEIHGMIDEDDIYTEEGDNTYGLEDEPHVTLLYGLHDDKVKSSDIMEACKKHELKEVKLHNISKFSNEKYDVLKFDAQAESLINCNKELTENFPYTTNFDYHPHCTIAYLKKGTADKYIKEMKDKSITATVNELVYSRPNGTKVRESLK